MYFFLTLIVLVVGWMIFGEKIKSWLRSLMMRKMEDAIRAQMGMPSRKEEERMKRKAKATSASAGRRPETSRHTYGSSAHHIIPPEYAEDAEFVEYKEFSHSESASVSNGGVEFKSENQVTDVEFTEIKTDNR